MVAAVGNAVQAYNAALLRALREVADQALRSTGINSSTLKSSPAAAVEVVAKLRAGITAQEIKIANMRGFLTESAPDIKQAMNELSVLRDQLAVPKKMIRKVEGTTTTSHALGPTSILRHFMSSLPSSTSLLAWTRRGRAP